MEICYKERKNLKNSKTGETIIVTMSSRSYSVFVLLLLVLQKRNSTIRNWSSTICCLIHLWLCIFLQFVISQVSSYSYSLNYYSNSLLVRYKLWLYTNTAFAFAFAYENSCIYSPHLWSMIKREIVQFMYKQYNRVEIKTATHHKYNWYIHMI